VYIYFEKSPARLATIFEVLELAATALSFVLISFFGGKFHIELFGSFDSRFVFYYCSGIFR